MFLPISKEDLKIREWDYVDFVYVIGDAYVDHPSFGPAIISRTLEAFGYRVMIISQPDYKNNNWVNELIEPKLGFLISSGNIDSMVNHYYVSKKRRSFDYYTPGGLMGKRPDDCVITYSKAIRKRFKDIPIIIGGIEASLRRLAHYDYIKDSLRKSILIDSEADLISYGMGETSIVEIADSLKSGLNIKDIIFIKGTVFKTNNKDYIPADSIFLPSYKELLEDKLNYARSFNIQYLNTDPYNSNPLVEEYDDIYVVQNTQSLPLKKEMMDWVYDLPYERKPHPIYESIGHIKAIDEIETSITINRGCFGACSFCAITSHQGRIIQSRSKESVVKEAKEIIKQDNFKGYISDIGGPTANFYNPSCNKAFIKGCCKDKRCLDPGPCKALNIDHSSYLDILKAVRSLDGVKKVFIRSGIRYDYLYYDKDDTFFKELVKNHVSGQLRVAPEHVSPNVLRYMGKPKKELYDKFVEKFYTITKECNKDQYVVPYLMSSHPGSTLKDAIMLAEYLNEHKLNVEQVQDFYPTPTTLSTCMYYTKVDPMTMEKVYIPETKEEKAMQRALIQYKNTNNYDLVYKALVLAKREDLIGSSPKCLIRNRGVKQHDKN